MAISCKLTIPFQGEYAYSDAMKEYAENNDAVYINLFEHVDEIGLDVKADFQDKTHLYTSGANKVSDYLGEFLVENYDLTDFRDIKNNIWMSN